MNSNHFSFLAQNTAGHSDPSKCIGNKLSTSRVNSEDDDDDIVKAPNTKKRRTLELSDDEENLIPDLQNTNSTLENGMLYNSVGCNLYTDYFS